MTRPHKILWTVAILLLVSCSRSTEQSVSDTSIIGGRIADDHKFMATMINGSENKPGCGGTFVTKTIVISAAHCFSNPSKKFRIRAGSKNAAATNDLLLDVVALVIHPQYDPETNLNDIVLLQVTGDQTVLDTIEPISFNNDETLPANSADEVLTVIGRGNTTSIGRFVEDVLRQVDVNVVPTAECIDAYSTDGINSTVICAGNTVTGGQDSCQGDSGGPLVRKFDGAFKLVGIVSWGEGCAQTRGPGVYTKVSSQALWIEQEIAKLTVAQPISVEQFPEVTKKYCYEGITTTTGIGAGDKTAEFVRKWTPTEVFAVSTQTDGFSTSNECSLPVPGASAMNYRLEAIPGVDTSEFMRKLSITDGSQKWEAAAASELSRIEVACNDSLDLVYELTGREESIYFNNSYFDFNGDFNGTIAGDAIRLQCEIEDLKVEFFIQSGNDGLEYIARLTGPDLGDGQTLFTLSKWGGSESSIVATLSIDVVSTDLREGKLSLLNSAENDLFTWNLVCNSSYTLKDEFGMVYPSVDLQNGKQEIVFISPATIHGTIRAGATKNFAISLPNSPTGVNDALTCEINGRKLSIALN